LSRRFAGRNTHGLFNRAHLQVVSAMLIQPHRRRAPVTYIGSLGAIASYLEREAVLAGLREEQRGFFPLGWIIRVDAGSLCGHVHCGRLSTRRRDERRSDDFGATAGSYTGRRRDRQIFCSQSRLLIQVAVLSQGGFVLPGSETEQHFLRHSFARSGGAGDFFA